MRPEIGKPLQAAQKLMKPGKHKEALAELRKLDNVGNKTANESYLIERVRAAAASSAGDYDTAARSFETLIASGKLSAPAKAPSSPKAWSASTCAPANSARPTPPSNASSRTATIRSCAPT